MIQKKCPTWTPLKIYLFYYDCNGKRFIMKEQNIVRNKFSQLLKLNLQLVIVRTGDLFSKKMKFF